VLYATLLFLMLGWPLGVGSVSFVMYFAVYAGSRISAQLLCNANLWMHCQLSSVFCAFSSQVLRWCRCRSLSPTSFHHPSTASFYGLEDLTANIPIAVTTLLFSLSVKACSVVCAKLGSASVRPFPLSCLGGMVLIDFAQCQMGAVSVCGRVFVRRWLIDIPRVVS
jgi:hypothetical protein